MTGSDPGGWVKTPNAFVRDKRLSWAARGVGTWLASHAAGFTVSIERIEAAGPGGRDLVRKAVAELERHGYLERSRVRNEKGHLGPASYRFTFDPQSLPSSEPTSDFPTLEKPTQAEPTLAAPTLENPTALRRTEGKKTKGLEDQGKEDHSLSAGPRRLRLDRLLAETDIKDEEREPFIKYLKSKADNLPAYLKSFEPGDMQANLDEWREQFGPRRPRADPIRQNPNPFDQEPCAHHIIGDCRQCLYDRVADLYLDLGGRHPGKLPSHMQEIWEQVEAASRTGPP